MTEPAAWVRVEPGECTCHRPPQRHDRWEAKNPNGDGRNYLVTDCVIRTYGRRHVEGYLLRNLPPLPAEAWDALDPPENRCSSCGHLRSQECACTCC